MGRKSLLFGKAGVTGGGGVVECVSQLVARLLPPPSDGAQSSTDPIWQTTDLALLGWLLVYLSACLDTAQPKDGCEFIRFSVSVLIFFCCNVNFLFIALNAWSRWNFLSGGNGNFSGNSAGSINGNIGKGSNVGINRFHRRKMQKRLVHKVEEMEAVRKAYQVSQQVQVCFYMYTFYLKYFIVLLFHICLYQFFIKIVFKKISTQI